MRLTVVMSVLNGERYVGAAVRSVLRQTFADFDFVVVDNGSTDGTGALLASLAAEDSRLTAIRNPKPGTYVEGRALGIDRAGTEWVALMDADDICHPTRLERQVAFVESFDGCLGALGTWGRYIDESGKAVGHVRTGPTTVAEFHEHVRKRDSMVLLDPSALFHRPSFLAAGGYRADAAPAADLDLWYRMAELGRPVLTLPETLMDYRVHPGAESARKHLLQRRKTHYINHNMRRRRDGLPEIDWASFEEDVWGNFGYRAPRLRRDLGFLYFRRAAMGLATGRYVRASSSLLLAALLNPTLVAKRLTAQMRHRKRK